MKKPKFIYKFLTFVAIVLIIAFLLTLDPVANQVSKVTGAAADKIKMAAQYIVGIALGVMLISWGIAAISLPLLGGAMILIGLAILAYSLWPLFKSNSVNNP
jgi:hypothetical protein